MPAAAIRSLASVIIAQITDLPVRSRGSMVNRVVETNAMRGRAVTSLNALRPVPDVVIATGDLVDTGRVEEYEVLREELSPLAMPVFLIPCFFFFKQKTAYEIDM